MELPEVAEQLAAGELLWHREAVRGDAVSVALFAATTAVVMLLVTMVHRVR